MSRQIVAFSLLPVAFGIIYIDRVTLDSNEKHINLSISYTRDESGNSVTNITFQTFDTAKRALFYIKANIAKDHNDRDCQIEMLNTVIDVAKFLKGMQGHFALRNLLQGILSSLDFQPKFPWPSVSEVISHDGKN